MTAEASRPPQRRILSLVLPYLSTDRLMRLRFGKSWRSGKPADAEPALVIVDKVKSAMRLVALNAPARAFGFHRGQALAEARAIQPALEAVEYDPRADAVFLGEIAGWADRYTPLVGTDGNDGLLLDITGCAHLFGGEATLAADIVTRLKRQGIAARAAIADTAGAAFAAARFGGPAVVPSGEEAAVLKGLPLLALRIQPETVATLERVGIKRIGQLLGAPRQPLAARFGPKLLQRLDQALGDEEEAISPDRPMPELVAERRFPEPISLLSDIAAVLRSLAATLARRLDERGIGGRRFELALYRVDGVVSRAEVGSGRPLRDPRLVGELFSEKFAMLGDEIDAGFGFDLVRLSILATDDATPAQIDLAGETDGEADLGRLVDRIGVRLGTDRIVRLETGESHVPERSGRAVPAGADARRSPIWTEAWADEPIDRPLRLLARPEPVETLAEIPEGPPLRFRWRHAFFEVARAEGPERIAAEWWREDGFTRDYFRVEDRTGQRFWLFREGLYGRDEGLPRWFLQGLFA
ncbi:MAG: DNA polymerase Y family protein [Bauldia sp.]|nr:DNA polymerase Y family protein [Bauldia sp.]